MPINYYLIFLAGGRACLPLPVPFLDQARLGIPPAPSQFPHTPRTKRANRDHPKHMGGHGSSKLRWGGVQGVRLFVRTLFLRSEKQK
ncbi:hypothetical protein B0T26DRAFT_697357 [Lasiosphaeria miniovina]|uniref:Uncharacterized protein n=1 Tax=Lasiosphaeria miniovina TaxID=1954250 RepID=A0AA40E7S6_9PEZI|nr:uncharacterized protein B0T26DRAFT_697357 [Lasiosphaeria miniovina]KAK0728242.1 hypothetical protein B0T26DRAFT_697357 [Lasiosphaeria miniovina]